MTIATRKNLTTNFTALAHGPIAATVDVTSGVLVPYNVNRSGLVIVNTSSTNKVFLAFGAAAVLNGGLCLMPGIGGRMDENTFVVDEVTAISDAGGTPVAVQEFSL